MGYSGDEAARYEHQNEHSLPDQEITAWIRAMTVAGVPPRGRLLDIGAGTGLLTLAMKRAGLEVMGLEPSASMIDRALKLHLELTPHDFRQADAQQPEAFASNTFDWVVSRQMLCHLSDPDKAFCLWLNWLKPGGRMLLVDGLWPRSSWSENVLLEYPFASLDNASAVARAASHAGFASVRHGSFDALNAARSDAGLTGVLRYLVVAQKPYESGYE